MNDHAAVIAALENAPSLVMPLVREVPPEVLKRRPAPDRTASDGGVNFNWRVISDELKASRV